MAERKLFLQIQSINIMYPSEENIIIVPITRTIEIIMSIQLCLFLWITINYKENGGKKSFLANPKHQYRVSQFGEHDCSANNNKNGDYNECPSLSHLMDELSL